MKTIKILNLLAKLDQKLEERFSHLWLAGLDIRIIL
jgi:hypothetical protein